MFKSRKYTIKNRHALDKRKLKENNLHFASALSEIGSDSIKRRQLDLSHFKVGAFTSFYGSSSDSGDKTKLVSGDMGTVIGTIDSLKAFEVEGDYTLSWTAHLRANTTDCRFVTCTPYIGSQIISSAEDSFFEFGYINNYDPVTCQLRAKQHYNPREKGDAVPREVIQDEFEKYGTVFSRKRGDLFGGFPEAFQGCKSQVTKSAWFIGKSITLSGIGCVNMPRSSANVGLVVNCQNGSEFVVESMTINLRRRHR